MIKLFLVGPKSTVASEKAERPGDNALYVVARELNLLGFALQAVEVAMLPDGKPISLTRRATAIKEHNLADVSLILGADAERSLKSWFPVNEAVVAAQPFFYINEPGRIKIELAEKIVDFYNEHKRSCVFGYDTTAKMIGGADL